MRILPTACLALAFLVGMPILGQDGARAQDEKPLFTQEGQASWFGEAVNDRKGVSGEQMDANQLTAGHETLPMGSTVKVTNLANGKSVEVRVVDRGPYKDGRVIDVSRRAAEELGIVELGTGPVRIEAFPSDQPSEEVARTIEELAER